MSNMSYMSMIEHDWTCKGMITSGCIWNLTRSHAFAAFARAEVCSASEPGYTHLDGTKRTKRTLDGIIGMQLIELIREMHEMHEMCGSSKTLRKENERDARRNLSVLAWL